jgi:hypothetical protein
LKKARFSRAFFMFRKICHLQDADGVRVDDRNDVDDAFDVDEAGDGSVEGFVRNKYVVDNYDEGLDFDEEDDGGDGGTVEVSGSSVVLDLDGIDEI